MPTWFLVPAAIVLVLGHLGTGHLLVGIAHATVFVFYLTAMTQTATGSDLLFLQGLSLTVTAGTLWARRAAARAAYWRRVHAVARFRDDVAAARRTYR